MKNLGWLGIDFAEVGNHITLEDPLKFFQTRVRGTNRQEFEGYLAHADDGNGIDITTGKPLKTFDEWMAA